jgi:outer membrane receptor protein involved in Fe transport
MRDIHLLGGAMACAVAFGAALATAEAQAPQVEIVVLARTPLDKASNAQDVTGAQIEAAHAADLTDYLRRAAPGVFVNDVQNNPLQPDINYRGFTASPLLGTPQGLSVYLDGMRLNQPFGDVVSWDLVPKSAIASVSITSGASPLFGRNALGGALSIRTRDGKRDPGSQIEASYGSWNRKTLSARTGGAASGLDWFGSVDLFDEDGWHDFSPSQAGQVFGKLGWSDTDSELTLSGAFADSDLNGNGLQEQTLLAVDRVSVYTQPDNTKNRAGFLNFNGEHRFSVFTLRGEAFWRRIRTNTYNGDVNDDALGEAIYQPSAGERTALTAAGFTGFPTAGETQDNTPFPRWRCIANALLNSEPNEKCDGLINRSRTNQDEAGATGEVLATAGTHAMAFGVNYVASQARFLQSSQFAYLTAERGVVGVTGPGAFADGSQNSENAFDARVDLSGHTQTMSLYGTDSMTLTPALRLDAAARYDSTRVHNRDRIAPGGGPGSLEAVHEFNRLNPAFALSWSQSPALALTAAAAETSRAPSAIELGCADPENPCRLPNALAGDPPLKQVVARTFELGGHGTLAAMTWQVTAFSATNRDDILFVTDDTSGFGYFRNFGKTRRQGVDVDVSGRTGRLSWSGHYSFLDATYRSEETIAGEPNSENDGPAPGFEGDIEINKGDRMPLIPRHTLKLGAGWEVARGLRLKADATFGSGVIARGNENNAHEPDGIYYLGTGETESYGLLNLGAEWDPAARVTLFAQANNVLDTEYATAAQLGPAAFNANGAFVARPFAAPVIGGERPLASSTFYGPGAPRSISVGVRARF